MEEISQIVRSGIWQAVTKLSPTESVEVDTLTDRGGAEVFRVKTKIRDVELQIETRVKHLR